MRHILLLFAISLFGSAAIAAPHKIAVISSGGESDEVVSAFKARINGTERYQIVEGLAQGQPEFFVIIVCMGMEKYHIQGAVCSYSFSYVPPQTAPLLWLRVEVPYQVAGPRREELGEEVFQAFV